MPGDATDALMFGGATTDLPPAALVDAMRRAGMRFERRDASPDSGAYARIVSSSGVDCSFERIAPAEYLVRGDAERLAPLESFARALSAALAAAGVRHRLEVYAEDDSLAAYFHHQWPQDAG